MDVPSPLHGRACGSLLAMICACVPEGPPSERGVDPSVGEDGASVRTVDDRPVDPALGARFSDVFEGASLGPAWRPLSPAWHLHEGWLCAAGAKNRGIWLRRRLPENARVTFDARSDHRDGDLKLEIFGDGIRGATNVSYDDASGYVLVFGGWQNRLHVLARKDEHSAQRLVARVREDATALRERPVEPGRVYHFEIERSDGRTIRWLVDGELIHAFVDDEPLAGPGNDHFGFNDWMTPVCFDNLTIEALDG